MMRRGFLFRLRQIALLTLVLGGFTTLIKASYVWEDWNRKQKIEPSGGCYFFRRVEIPVPQFRQGDERWRGFWITPWGQRATPDELAAMFGELFALAQCGRLRANVERLYPIDAFADALADAQRSGRRGKVLFSFEDLAPSLK